MNLGSELFKFGTNAGRNFRRGTENVMAEGLKFANEGCPEDNKRRRI